jgi:hypothetical protein
MESWLDQQGLCPLDWAGEAKSPLGESQVELGEGQSEQAVGHLIITHDSSKKGSSSGREGKNLNRIPGLERDVDLQYLLPSIRRQRPD